MAELVCRFGLLLLSELVDIVGQVDHLRYLPDDLGFKRLDGLQVGLEIGGVVCDLDRQVFFDGREVLRRNRDKL